MVIAAVLGIGSIAIPYVVVPIRRHLGLPTYQWDNDPATHPVSSNGPTSLCASVYNHTYLFSWATTLAADQLFWC